MSISNISKQLVPVSCRVVRVDSRDTWRITHRDSRVRYLLHICATFIKAYTRALIVNQVGLSLIIFRRMDLRTSQLSVRFSNRVVTHEYMFGGMVGYTTGQMRYEMEGVLPALRSFGKNIIKSVNGKSLLQIQVVPDIFKLNCISIYVWLTIRQAVDGFNKEQSPSEI